MSQKIIELMESNEEDNILLAFSLQLMTCLEWNDFFIQNNMNYYVSYSPAFDKYLLLYLRRKYKIEQTLIPKCFLNHEPKTN